MKNRFSFQIVTIFSACLALELSTACLALAAPDRDLLSDATSSTSTSAAEAVTASDLEEEAKLLKALEGPNKKARAGKEKVSAPAVKDDLGLVEVTTEAAAANAAWDEI